MVIAYLMAQHGMSLQQALAHVQTRHELTKLTPGASACVLKRVTSTCTTQRTWSACSRLLASKAQGRELVGRLGRGLRWAPLPWVPLWSGRPLLLGQVHLFLAAKF